MMVVPRPTQDVLFAKSQWHVPGCYHVGGCQIPSSGHGPCRLSLQRPLQDKAVAGRSQYAGRKCTV